MERPHVGVRDRNWIHDLAQYRVPDQRRSIYEILITAAPFAGLWLLAWAALSISYVLTLILAVPAAGFLVRLFMIQHDCGHGAFFSNRPANDLRMSSATTFAP